MSELNAVQAFAARAGRLSTPLSVLDALGELSEPIFGVQPLCAWYLTRGFAGQEATWRPGETLFLGRAAPRGFFDRYCEAYRQNGYSFMSLKARQVSLPFTFAEAEKEAKKQRACNRWVFDFMRSYGISDGLYCPLRRWGTVFFAAQLLALSPIDRILLAAVMQIAIGRIEQLAMPSRRKGKTPSLTQREREVLQQLAIHGEQAAAAEVLGITVAGVDAHLRSVRKKLAVKTTSQALLTAFKFGLIEY